MELINTENISVEVNVVELVVPIVVLAFGSYYFIDTRDLPDRSMLYAEPLLFATIIFAILAIFMFGVEIGNGERQKSQSTNSMAGYVRDGAVNYRNPILILLLTIIYLILVPFTFEVATFAYLFGALWVLGERNFRVLIVYSGVLSITIFAVFKWWLNIPL